MGDKLMDFKYLYVFIIVFICLRTAGAFASDVYMSTTGTKITGKSTTGDWSNANCYNNLTAAFAAMSSGDTLTVDDGNYTSHLNTIGWDDTATAVNKPPSGSGIGSGDTRFTVIRAKNIPCQNGVSCDQPLKVRFSGAAVFNADSHGTPPTYIKFWGIRWDGISTYTGWNNLYFKQVASQGVSDGNTAPFSITGQYNLLEDCVAFGKGRYKYLFYDNSRELQTNGDGNNVCRRCIARHDWAKKEDVSGDPIATFVSYYSRGTSFLNAVDIDSNMPVYWMDAPGEFNGSFSQPVDGGVHKMTISGSLVINSAQGVGWGASPSTTADSGNTFIDVVGVNVAGGINLRGGGNINRLGLYNVNLSNFTYRSSTQSGQILQSNVGVDSWDNNVLVNNSIFRNLAGAPLKGNTTGYYIDTYTVGTGGNTLSNSITTDPYQHGVKYPVRIETTSPNELQTQGTSGSQIGPRILNKLGIDGTFKGDTGWNTEQGGLWPWPLEEWIQAEMRTSDYASFCAPYVGTPQACPTSYTTDAYRGFASTTDRQLDGVSDVTLTSYIWESLGNQIPADIYGAEGPPDTLAPVTIPSHTGRLSAKQEVTLAVNETATTQYCYRTTTCTPTTTYSGAITVYPGNYLCFQSTDSAGNAESTRCEYHGWPVRCQ